MTENLETRVAKIEGVVSQLTESIGNFITASDRWRSEVRSELHALSEKTAPNFSTMAGWSGILLTVIGMVATPCCYFVIREMERQEIVSRELDTKLQREQSLVAEKLKSESDSLRGELHDVKELGSPVTRERLGRIEATLSGNSGKISRLEEWSDGQIKDDLEELRQRRLRDTAKK